MKIGEGIDALHKGKLFKTLWNKIYKKEIIKENNIKFDFNIWKGEDYKFNIDYFRYVSKIIISNENLYNYSVGENGLTYKYDYKEFERRISNLNHHRDLYIEKNFKLDYVNTLYIISAMAGVIKIDLKKENLDKEQFRKKVYNIINNKDIEKSLTMKNDGNIVIKILGKILKYKWINCIILLSKLKIK